MRVCDFGADLFGLVFLLLDYGLGCIWFALLLDGVLVCIWFGLRFLLVVVFACDFCGLVYEFGFGVLYFDFVCCA